MLLLMLYHVAICHSETESILFSYPIHNLTDASVQNILSNSIRQLSVDHYFKIDNFLSDYGLRLFQQISHSEEAIANTVKRDVWKSIFGDQGDYINFPNASHPRNILGNLKVGTIGATSLPSVMRDMFRYDPLLQFLKQIVVTAENNNFTDLYLSNDTDGSAYIFTYTNGQFGEYHFDQHPFTCVYMITKPDIGGHMFRSP